MRPRGRSTCLAKRNDSAGALGVVQNRHVDGDGESGGRAGGGRIDTIDTVDSIEKIGKRGLAGRVVGAIMAK